MSGPRVLTFNFHEPYLCLMAKTRLPLFVGSYDAPPLARAWQTKFRPIPPNVTILPERQWRDELKRGEFQVVIAQNEMNAADVVDAPCAKLVVCHNRRNFLELAMTPENRTAYAALLTRLSHVFTFVFISEMKRASYRLEGEVILPGIDADEYGGYRGEVAAALIVGNAMRARNSMFDVDLQDRILAAAPNRIVGEDPQRPEARPTRDFADLLELYCSHRCLLHITREGFEDGYNLAMLEAMAVGMPIVSWANSTSPLTDGYDGFVSNQEDELRERVVQLLGDRQLANEMGKCARETVREAFPIQRFAERWTEVIQRAADETSTMASGQPGVGRGLNVLLEYTAGPFTTGRYFEAALRESCNVVTMGPRCPESMVRDWGFKDPIPEYRAQDIPIYQSTFYAEALSRAPKGFQPDIFIYVDSGRPALSPGIHQIRCPKMCYLIDTHIDAHSRIEIAKAFDGVFIAQKGQLELFKRAGIQNVAWLPLACSPELYDRKPRERNLDVAYVGSLNDADGRRKGLLDSVRERFPNSFIGKAWPREMADIYSRAKIVVNAAVNRDVNMRVFEAMAGGALLITDEADGLEDMFQDGEHLVVYRRDEDVLGLVRHYLDAKEERERITTAGRDLVLRKHTYAKRAATMLRSLQSKTPNAKLETGGYYASSRPELVPHVPITAQRILDVGCGAGAFGKALKDRGAREVVGIEVVPEAYERARLVLDDAICASIENVELPFSDTYFDCVVCGDVLEHLVDPVAALRKLTRVLRPDGVIVISIPNVRFYAVVNMLAEGRWQYADAGIMDRTHLRFFTKTELIELVSNAGLELKGIGPLSMAPENLLSPPVNGDLTIGRMTLHGVTPQEYEEFRVFQYVIVAIHRKHAPITEASANDIGAILDGAKRAAAEGRDEDSFNRYMKVVEAEFDNAEAISGAVLTAKTTQQLSTLERMLRRYVEFFPANADMSIKHARVLLALGRKDKAIVRLEESLSLFPDHKEARALLEKTVTAQ